MAEHKLSYTASEIDNRLRRVDDIPVVDSELSTTSTNPVQNKVITSRINSIESSLNQKANTSAIPTKTSQLTNNSGFLTSIPSEYVTETELTNKGYATQASVAALSNKIDNLPTGGNITVDSSLSSTSTNPVQNKVITEAVTLFENEFTVLYEDLGNTFKNVYEDLDAMQNEIDNLSVNGGNGTQVQADWNQSDSTAVDFIKNRPFYEIAGETIIDGDITTDANGMCYGDTVFQVEHGDTVNVKIGTKEYSQVLVCEINDGVSAKAIGIGNKFLYLKAFSSMLDRTIEEMIAVDPKIAVFNEDTGEPFFIMGAPSDYQGDDAGYCVILDNSPNTTVHLTINKGEIKQLDEKFIPDTIARVDNMSQSDYNQNDSTSPDYIKNRPFYKNVTTLFDGNVTTELSSQGFIVKNVPINQDISIETADFEVVMDGKSYISQLKYYETLGYIGNMYLASAERNHGELISAGIVNTGEPFCVIPAGSIAMVCTKEVGTYHFTVNNIKEIKQIDEVYIPDTIARLSDISTGGSDITVDSSLSETSTNPVQNKVVTAKFTELSNRIASSGGSGSGGGDAIIDVGELPSEYINEQSLYRLVTGTFVYNQYPQDDIMTCYCVEEYPEVGEAGTNLAMEYILTYYNITDGTVKAYVDSTLSSALSYPVGWYDVALLFPLANLTYSGVITDISEDPKDSTVRLLLTYEMYSYKGKWTAVGSGAMPKVNSDDEGKILMVVDGQWAATAIENGDEVAY